MQRDRNRNSERELFFFPLVLLLCPARGSETRSWSWRWQIISQVGICLKTGTKFPLTSRCMSWLTCLLNRLHHCLHNSQISLHISHIHMFEFRYVDTYSHSISHQRAAQTAFCTMKEMENKSDWNESDPSGDSFLVSWRKNIKVNNVTGEQARPLEPYFSFAAWCAAWCWGEAALHLCVCVMKWAWVATTYIWQGTGPLHAVVQIFLKIMPVFVCLFRQQHLYKIVPPHLRGTVKNSTPRLAQ